MTNRKEPAASARYCTACGAELTAGARFCHRCGAAVDGTRAPATAAAPGLSRALPWSVLALALVALIALVFAQNDLRPVPPDMGSAPLGGPMSGAVPDISNMSPQERADRLFNRVMSLSSEGKADSAASFSPMALSAFDALAPHNAHQRYDIGLIALVSGRPELAAAQADTMLAQRPTHLLGLALAIRAAEARRDATARAGFQRRLIAAEPAEMATGLQEYGDHNADIIEALRAARAP
ncbi:MAG: zinc ribbon domain-containing protein [Gemmatimonadaceae bacterium]